MMLLSARLNNRQPNHMEKRRFQIREEYGDLNFYGWIWQIETAYERSCVEDKNE